MNCPSRGAHVKQPQPDPHPLLDDIEGLAVTGRPHGRPNLLLVSDDIQKPVQITRFSSLRVRLPWATIIAEG
ncbi:hypothetical protein GCM10011579_013220 [Streptomyces albiflavescens]|uniref:Uncharacterized protein n=1 Tax=Streptomyces albiflavescens TaxID=1623582 RepID=A0A917XVJ1_9ACTN|nr:hypothetical protein [Streptomyces albiflavescens]GGN54304.1 hypothetical protein GCM10011579_013220 [Streptomyces albiflavescens]